MGQYLSQNSHEVALSFISCSTTKVSPRSRSCLENTSTNYDNKSATSLWSSWDQDMHPRRSICSSMILSGVGTFGSVSDGNQLRSSSPYAVGTGFGQLSIFGMVAPEFKCPYVVTNAYMPGTSLAACIWLMTH